MTIEPVPNFEITIPNSGGSNGTLVHSINAPVLTINSGHSDFIVKFHPDGRIEYNGPADEAARGFLDAVNIQINKKNLNERIAKERLHDKLEHILDVIETMSKDEIIDYVQGIKYETHKELTWEILKDESKEK